MLVSQRERLIEATVGVVVAKGYAATSVGDIIKLARVSRTTFYEQFGDKQEALLAAYEQATRIQFEHVHAAARQAAGTVHRLQSGVRAYLEVLGDDPAGARVSLLEALSAGPAVAAARDRVHRRYADLLRKWHAEARSENEAVPPMPDEVFDCAVGGVAELVASAIRPGDRPGLQGLAPVIVTFLLNVAAVPAGRDLAAALSASRARRGGAPLQGQASPRADLGRR